MLFFCIGLCLLKCMVWAYQDQCIFQPRSQSVKFLRKPQSQMNHEEHDTFKFQEYAIPRQVANENDKYIDRNMSRRKSGPILRINLYRTRSPPVHRCFRSFSYGADVSMILDDSASQDPLLFERQKEFAKSLISSFTIGTNHFRFSVSIVQRSEATVQFGLDTYLTNDSLVSAIDNIQQTNMTSNTHEAMSAIRKEVFENSIKAKYVITLGDGMVSNFVETLAEVDRMKTDGITLVAVGFGSQVLHQGLINCATDHEHVFSPTTDDLKNWLSIRHVINKCPVCSIRSSDVFILLESSVDLDLPKFYALKDALKTLVVRMPISLNGVHASFSTFTDSVNHHFDFITHYDSSSIMPNIMSVSREIGTSNHTNALKHIRDRVFQNSNGYRQGSRKIVILFISEVISDVSKVFEQADALKSEGVIIVAVTVALTTRIDISSLLQIVSDPAHLFVIGDKIYGDMTSQHAMLSLFDIKVCG